MRYLCFDIGTKRTGVAVGDDETNIAGPLDVLECPIGSGLAVRLGEIIAREQPDIIVVGHPLNMDGSEGPQARAVRTMAEQIAEQTGLDVKLHDERLSTDSAHEKMARSGLTHQQKKARRDALAATAILQDYLNEQASSHDNSPPTASSPEDPDEST